MKGAGPIITSPIEEAYDAIARHYDEDVAAASGMRRRLWARMDELWSPGMTVLDIGAGTGIDAAYLTRRGIRVVALDAAPEMLHILRQRCPGVETVIGDFADMSMSLRSRSFDGVISSFAALSTAAELGTFAAGLANCLVPGGVALLHMLNRWPVLDLARFICSLNVKPALETSLVGRRRIMIGARYVTHYFRWPCAMYRRWFAKAFALEGVEGMGVIVPASWRNRPFLEAIDNRLGPMFPFNSLGTFFVLKLRRRRENRLLQQE